MIEVLCVDDHPAMRAGLRAVLMGEPGVVPRHSAATASEALEASGDVDVVLADFRLPDLDGVELCRRLKREPAAPRVLIYSEHALSGLALPARLAGADGVLHKGAPAEVLFEAIRVVAGGGKMFPDAAQELAAASTERIAPEDLPILGMVADGAPLTDVAEVLRLSSADLQRRLAVIIDLLKPEGRAPSGLGDR